MKIPSNINEKTAKQIVIDTKLDNYVRDNDAKSIEFDREDIEQIHNFGLEKYGGANGVIDENLLNSVIVNPYEEFFGQTLYPTVFDKAAKYMFDFSNYQVFRDGNKRVGIDTADEYLKANGYNLNMSFSECYQVAMNIANHTYTEPSEISEILQAHSVQNDIGKSISADADKTDNLEQDLQEKETDEGKEV